MPTGCRRRTGSGWDEKNSQPEDRRALAGFWGFWVPANRTGAIQDRQRGTPFARPAETMTFGEARDSSTNSPTTGLSPAERVGSQRIPASPRKTSAVSCSRASSPRGVRGLGSEVHVKPPRAGRESGHGPLSVAGPTVPAVDPRPLVAMWNRFRRAGCG